MNTRISKVAESTCIIIFYWLFVFWALKAFWIVANFELISTEASPIVTFYKAIYYGFFLDLALACQIATLIALLRFFAFLGTNRFYRLFEKLIFLLALIYVVAIGVGEAVTYKHWGAKLSFRAIQILQTPSELVAIATPTELFLLFGTIFTIILGFFVVALKVDRLFMEFSHTSFTSRVKKTLFQLLLIAPLFLGARGGWKLVPINTSSSHYSNVPVLNDSATNPAWNFSKSVLTFSLFIGKKNPFILLTDERKKELLHKYFFKQKLPTSNHLLRVKQPHLVILVLESWSSAIIEKLGGFSGVTPHFNDLTREGVLFTNFFSSGNRSQQGMAAIFSGFPAIPYATASEDTSFTKNMPKLTQSLKSLGYKSFFFYGGQLQFGNIKSLLLYNGFMNLVEDWDLPQEMPRGQMGVRDGPMLEHLLKHLDSQKGRHISAFFSVSTHTPFDLSYDWEPQVGAPSDRKYLISARYADEKIGEFFSAAKKRPWFDDTLFMIVADHSYPTSMHKYNSDPDYRRIPFLLLGGALNEKYRGTTIDVISSQIDIPATLSSAFGLSNLSYKWSKDLFSSDFNQYAYYDINDGGGLILPSARIKLNAQLNKCTDDHQQDISDREECDATKAFVQDLVESFMEGM